MSIPDPVADFEAYQKSLFRALVSASNAANSIKHEDIGFYRSLDRDFATDLDQASATLLSTANELTNHTALDVGHDDTNVNIEDIDDINDRFFGVIDVVDSLFERVDLTLDELAGRTRNTDVSEFASRGVTQLSTTSENGSKLEYKLLNANIVRPQLRFTDKVDNATLTPFVPKIKEKPNALVPLALPTSKHELAANPYIYEIDHFVPPKHLFESRDPVEPASFEGTEATWVDTQEGLMALLEHLDNAKEIAVDLEHHDYRSYQGFTCLMQLSTREKDFIIDALALRDKLWMLNTIFSDPDILKVFHGATSDIVWLQRDFGIYVVGLFDTYDATKVLDFPKHSLAFLLDKYCQFTADKRYQLADWRIRPVPEEMLAYARSDTHYLLYIYDELREALLSQSNDNHNLMYAVLARSGETSKTSYQKEAYDAETGLGMNGWAGLLRKRKYPMNVQQLAVYKAIHQWRDSMARQDDESLRYILPNHMMFAMVDRMPDDAASVIGCCNPCPPCVRINAQVLALAIQRAKADAVHQLQQQQTSANVAKEDENGQKPSGNANAHVTANGLSAQPSKKPIQKVDPASFDLSAVQRERAPVVARHATKNSILFDTNALATRLDENDDDAARAVASHIRATLTIRLPVEDLKIKAVYDATQLKAQQAAAAAAAAPADKEEDADEHVYVPSKSRSTKTKTKRKHGDDDDDVVILKDYGGARKKPSARNKQK
ncbi:ribonuclease H-like domain-containing protein [Gongronella butleri]|nr:ribonuclease H-like domain-containing protein [Gongronella butleri]